MSGGKQANESGGAWEAWVKLVSSKHGFQILNFNERHKHTPLKPGARYVWLRTPYTTIYQTDKTPKANSEFVFETEHDLIRMECKWQAGSGSVDEKLLFMYINSILTMEEPTIIFGLGGSYFTEKERGRTIKNWFINACKTPPKWLSEEAKQRWEKKELLVLDTNTFERWFRERFKK